MLCSDCEVVRFRVRRTTLKLLLASKSGVNEICFNYYYCYFTNKLNTQLDTLLINNKIIQVIIIFYYSFSYIQSWTCNFP